MGHDAAAAAAVTDEDHEDNEITRPQLTRSDSDVKSAERGGGATETPSPLQSPLRRLKPRAFLSPSGPE